MQIQLPRGGEQDSEEMDTEEQATSSGNQVPLHPSLAPWVVCCLYGAIYMLHSMHSEGHSYCVRCAV